MHHTTTRASGPEPARRNAAVRTVTAALTSTDRKHRALQEAHPAPGMPERLTQDSERTRYVLGPLPTPAEPINALMTEGSRMDRSFGPGRVVRWISALDMHCRWREARAHRSGRRRRTCRAGAGGSAAARRLLRGLRARTLSCGTRRGPGSAIAGGRERCGRGRRRE